MKALVLSLLVAAGLWFSYQAGQNKITIQCQQTLTSLSEQSEASRKADEDKINDLETKRVKAEQTAGERSRLLAERLQRDKPRVSDNPDKPACPVSPTVISVLNESTSDPRLSEASDPTGFVSPEETVTANTVAEYSLYTIEEYNTCAADYNALIDMIK